MDLRNPIDLANVIEALFMAACRDLEFRSMPTREAMRPLIAPGENYPEELLANIDLNHLAEALRAVAEAMQREGRGSFLGLRSDRPAIESALRASTCHYIWLC